MTTTSPHGDQPISRRQDEAAYLRMRAAAGITYDRAERIHAAKTLGAIGLAVLAPLVAVFLPEASTVLATVAVAWLLIARTLLDYWHRKCRLQAVRYHELYDTELYGLPWNTTLSGSQRLVRESLAALDPQPRDEDKEWYVSIPNVPWPLDVLAAQVQNLLWSRRNHRSYAVLLWTLLVLTVVAATLIATVRDLTLQQAIIQLAVPLIPALLDLSDLPRRHLDAAREQEQVEEAVDDLLAQRAEGLPITAEHCREVQDAIFERRAHQPPVPSRVYQRTRRATNAAAVARMHDLQNELNLPPS